MHLRTLSSTDILSHPPIILTVISCTTIVLYKHDHNLQPLSQKYDSASFSKGAINLASNWTWTVLHNSQKYTMECATTTYGVMSHIKCILMEWGSNSLLEWLYQLLFNILMERGSNSSLVWLYQTSEVRIKCTGFGIFPDQMKQRSCV